MTSSYRSNANQGTIDKIAVILNMSDGFSIKIWFQVSVFSQKDLKAILFQSLWLIQLWLIVPLVGLKVILPRWICR